MLYQDAYQNYFYKHFMAPGGASLGALSMEQGQEALANMQAIDGEIESLADSIGARLGRIQTAMIIGCAFIEALTIYALISVFLVGNAGWAPSSDESAGAESAVVEKH